MTTTNLFNIEIQKAKPNELNELANMASEIWHDHYTKIIGKEQVIYMLEKFYSNAALLEQIQQGQEFRFIIKDGEKIGFIATTIKNDQYIFINKFYIKSNQQSSNIGSTIMVMIQNEFKEISSKKIVFELTVNRQNFKAINFYFKNGFKIVSIADFNIGNGFEMNDFIMQAEV